MIPYSRQSIDKQDIKKIVNVLKGKFVTSGPKIDEFENKIKNFTQSKYAVAVNSATSALHISCLALGLKKKDYLWTSPISFVASANCALYCGAKVDFVDIDLKTYNISVVELEKKLIKAKKQKKLPKIIVVVNFAGQACQLDKIKSLSKKYKFKILEDSSHALGASYKNQILGNCYYSDITVFSFHPVKIITTLEGGMAVTNNAKIANKLNMLRNHGITRKKNFLKKNKNKKWYYEQQLLGYNYRMNDVQAALGTSQLKKIEFFYKKRLFVKNFYDKNLKRLPLEIPYINKTIKSSLHLYVVLLSKKFSKNKRDELINFLRRKEIETNIHYIPIYSQPYYENLGFKKKNFPNAENYYKRAISLPIHPKLNQKNLKYIVRQIEIFFTKKSKI
tara:strand:- start:11258 stop:12430 length:1173 start_codon:yes stop_codon:yes gene_type:complete